MLDTEFDAFVKETKSHAQDSLGAYLESRPEEVTAEDQHLIYGDPPVVIPWVVEKTETDLLVMGTVGRSGLYGFLMGNTAERILNKVDCSILAVKPSGFVCPVKLNRSEQKTEPQETS